MHLLWRSIFGVLKNFYKKILDTFKIKDFEVFDAISFGNWGYSKSSIDNFVSCMINIRNCFIREFWRKFYISSRIVYKKCYSRPTKL